MPASLSGLRIQRCRELWCRSQTWIPYCRGRGLGRQLSASLIPSLGTSTYAPGVALKNQKEKKNPKNPTLFFF